jgi:hypothetical protein
MGATFMKLGRAPTTFITLSMDKQRSFSKHLVNDFISADFKMFGNVVKNTRESAEFEGIVPRDRDVMFATKSGG